MPDPAKNVPEIQRQYEEAPVSSAEVMKTTAETGSSETIHAAPQLESGREDMSVFFGIGIVVNLTMFTALLIWGFNQWKQNNARKK